MAKTSSHLSVVPRHDSLVGCIRDGLVVPGRHMVQGRKPPATSFRDGPGPRPAPQIGWLGWAHPAWRAFSGAGPATSGLKYLTRTPPRELAPSFTRTLRRCVRTVCLLRPSFSPISSVLQALAKQAQNLSLAQSEATHQLPAGAEVVQDLYAQPGWTRPPRLHAAAQLPA